MNPGLAPYGSKKNCARTDTVFFPISQVCNRRRPFDKFVIDHAITIKLKFLVNKTQKKNLSYVRPTKQSRMAAMPVGIDFKNISLLFQIYTGKITHPRT